MAWYVLGLIGVVLIVVVNWFLRNKRIANYETKRVFISGCDSGFGNMLAKRLDGLGFTVYAGCLTEDGQQSVREKCSGRVITVPLDVTSDTSIEKAFELVRRNIPKDEGLWALVNNAGVANGVGPTSWYTRQDYDQVMAVNLYGAIFLTKAFVPLLVPAKGRIVNMSSTLGRISFAAVAYCISKYGLEAFSDMLRLEMKMLGVKVSIIEPGFFNTTLMDEDRYRKAVQAKLNSLPVDVKKSTPDFVVEQIKNSLTFIKKKLASEDTYKVVDAYVDAVTARYPKARYLVGTDVKYFYRVLWNLPECLSDTALMMWLNR